MSRRQPGREGVGARRSPRQADATPHGVDRLALVTSSFPYGPAEAFLEPEARHLAKLVSELVIVPVHPIGDLPPARHDLPVLALPLVDPRVVLRGLLALLRRPARSTWAIVRLLRGSRRPHRIKTLAVVPKALAVGEQLRRSGVDHIHCHWAGPPASFAMLVSAVTGIPWSLTAHARDIEVDDQLRVKIGHARLTRFISKAGLARAREICGWGGEPPAPLMVVHLGIETGAPGPPPPPGPVHLLAAGRLIERKGYDLLLRSLARARERCEVTLDIAGEGPLGEALVQLAGSLGLGRSVRFLGHLEHEALLERLRTAGYTACVLASHSEGIPVVLMEAMAASLPVIATRVGGVEELVDEASGLLVPDGDVIALAEAIVALDEDPTLRTRLSGAGRQRVQREFDAACTTADLLQAIRTVS